MFERWVSACPLAYKSGNAPDKRDVLGTVMLGLLAGHRRYAHITAPRGDGVAAQALGVPWQYQHEGLRATAFASHDRQRLHVDEMPGLGTSGPYANGQPDALAHSEQVTLLVRDRQQPAVALQRRTLTRFVDYDFEPFSGRLVFRQPVPSVDEHLNPVSIRVSYEVPTGGPRFWVAGANAVLRLNEHWAIGGAYAQDSNPLAPFKLGGVNSQLQLGPRTHASAEWARSQGSNFYNQDVAALTALGTPLAEQAGQAARIELRHDGSDVQWQARAARAQAGFQNSQGGLSPGRQELSLQASQALSKGLRLRGELNDSQDRSGTANHGAARRSGSVTVEWALGTGLRLDLSARHVSERQVSGPGGAAGLGGVLSAADAQSGASSVAGLGAGTWSSFGFAGSGLLSSPVVLAPTLSGSPALVSRDYTSLRLRLSQQLTEPLRVYAEYEQTDADRQRAALGADYRLGAKLKVYARHEFANNLTGVNGLTSEGERFSSVPEQRVQACSI